MNASEQQALISALQRLVAPLEHVRLSRCVSHAPILFFESIFSSTTPSFARWVQKESRRELKLPHCAHGWESQVTRRITRAVQNVKVLFDEAWVYGYGRFTAEEQLEQAVRWLVLDWQGRSMSEAKCHTLWLSAYGRRIADPLTESQRAGLSAPPGTLLTVKYARWCKQKLHSTRNEQSKLLGAMLSEQFLQGTKRGMTSVDDEGTTECVLKFMDVISTEKPLVGDERLVRLVQFALQKTAIEVFGHVNSVKYTPFGVSQRAGFEEDGSKATLPCVGHLGWLIRRDASLLGWVELQCMGEGRPGDVYETHALMIDSKRVYERMLLEWDDEVAEHLAECEIYAIREPLKIRTITAGSPSLYGGLGPFLQHLRRGMARFDVFRLTREEVTREAVENRLRLLPGYSEWNHFASADFVQSTNLLSMKATQLMCDAVFSGTARNIAEKALGRQLLNYDGVQVLQRNGQLMGSPISFPFLCVAVMATVRLAYELVHPELVDVPLDALPALNNGDDLLARMSPAVYEMWLKIIAVVGWSLSPGKSYFLKDLAQINSQTYPVEEDFDLEMKWDVDDNLLPITRTWKVGARIPFMNGAFVQQMGKTVHELNAPSIESISLEWSKRYSELLLLPGVIGKRARAVMHGNLVTICERLYEQGRTPFRLCPTNPTEAGGLGLDDDEYELDLHAAWYGLHCRAVRADSVASRLAHGHEMSRPLLMWCDALTEWELLNDDRSVRERLLKAFSRPHLLRLANDFYSRKDRLASTPSPSLANHFLDVVTKEYAPCVPLGSLSPLTSRLPVDPRASCTCWDPDSWDDYRDCASCSKTSPRPDDDLESLLNAAQLADHASASEPPVSKPRNDDCDSEFYTAEDGLAYRRWCCYSCWHDIGLPVQRKVRKITKALAWKERVMTKWSFSSEATCESIGSLAAEIRELREELRALNEVYRPSCRRDENPDDSVEESERRIRRDLSDRSFWLYQSRWSTR